MLLPCLALEAHFPAEGLLLQHPPEARMLWDCHHGDIFVLKVGHLIVKGAGADLGAPLLRVTLGLTPPAQVLSLLEQFAAAMQLPLPAKGPPAPGELLVAPVLAACHVPDAKLFIFSEAATMKVKPGEAALELEIAGKFHSRRIPCQEADLVVHLTKADSLRLLGAAYQIVRAGL